ncbi:hypothetical protein [Staphylococcus pseudoxylosus]|uniref:hypothetical protein n=1 Tax=Staphylococcus pseudoxylosus TaxID=2282419 RepID=UPI00301B6334
MKKLLVLMLSAGLVLGACGNNESKSEDKKQDVKSDSEKKKAKKQKEEKEKQEQKAKDEKAKKEKQAKDEQRKKDEELAQQNSQQTTNQNEQTPVQNDTQQSVQQEPTDQEKAEANARVAKENGYTGIPNGDAHSDVPVGQIELPPDELAKEEAKPEYHNTVEPEEDDEPLEWVEDENGDPTLKGGL